MKKWTKTLFFTGLIIQLLAFFVDQATEIPLVLRMVAPTHYHSKAGIESLLAKKKLAQTDDGFREIASTLLNDFRKRNNVSANIKDLKVERIWLEIQATRGDQPVEGYTLVDFEISTETTKVYGIGGNIGFMTLERLEDAIEALKKPNILIVSILMFLVGSLIEILAFYAEHSKSKRPSKRSKEKTSDVPSQT